MSLKLSLLLLLTAGNLINFFGGQRYYPYSNYWMFAFKRKNLSYYGLALKKNDHEFTFLNQMLYPMTRLHIHQTIAASLNNNTGFEWINLYFQKLKKSSEDFLSLVVVQAEYDPKDGKSAVKKIIYEKNN